jgi:hypothetical protein
MDRALDDASVVVMDEQGDIVPMLRLEVDDPLKRSPGFWFAVEPVDQVACARKQLVPHRTVASSGASSGEQVAR